MFRLKSHINDSFFDDIYGKRLDKYQKKVVMDESKELLVIAGAGSGKTLTILAKIKYLIEVKGIKADEILCLSFTNEAVNNIKERISYPVDVYTFHKLALNILRENNYDYNIASDTLLNYLVSEFFLIKNERNRRMLQEYFLNKKYEDILRSKEFIILKNNIISFIKIIKCYNLSISKIKKLKRKCISNKNKVFFYFTLCVFNIYENELLSENKIDFDDMIVYARDYVRKKGIKRNYRYIIIDEYQDISPIRFSLILEIKKYLDCNLICVGDDFQAIYGFSGSNLSLFLDFFKYFPNGSRIDIKNTYRNSYELINTSLKFIKKNPYQVKKTICATFFYKNPIIIVYYDDYLKTYNDLLNYLYLENEKNILILARYNKDLDDIKKIEHKGINIRYLTVHMSKGLEEDVVILTKFSNDYLGFPSKILDNEFLMNIKNNSEDIPYAEERRLFYVALTRCKRRIFLLVPRNNPSIFLKEIKSSCVELLFK